MIRTSKCGFLAAALFATLLASAQAQADHYKFIIVFTTGTLAGTWHVGYATTDGTSGNFMPGNAAGHRLLSLSVNIPGAPFKIVDDKDFPTLPRLNITSTGNLQILDFDASNGSAANVHDKWMWMYRHVPDGANSVKFGSWLGRKRIEQSTGVIWSFVKIEPREASPEPDCAVCHTRTPK